MELYYRYRPGTETAYKEFLYSEMYFASQAECNDPFDCKVRYRFPADLERWTRLVSFALWGPEGNKNAGDLPGRIAASFVAEGPMGLDESLSLERLREIVRRALPVGLRTETDQLGLAVKRLMRMYAPRTRYFVSFSKTETNPLMWSHYASRHQGFCLIFRSADGKLAQCGNRMRRQVERVTPRNFTPQISFGLPEGFVFQDVDYTTELEALDAFQCFPQSVAGPALAEAERQDFIRRQERQYLQKHPCWSYEQESRLLLSPPMPWLCGVPAESEAEDNDADGLSEQERLLHFEPSQLVGVVLGAMMPPRHKRRIHEVVATRQKWLAQSVNYQRKVLNFVVFEANLVEDSRGVEVTPSTIYGFTKPILRGAVGFDQLYGDWQAGRGLSVEGSSTGTV